MTSTFGAATASNPRPFKCTDCKSAFRIHGHLAKHLRSKMHIMKLECLRKLPFGTYAEMERSGINLNDIDTTDCDSSLTSLQIMARKLSEKDTSKLGQWEVEMGPNTLSSGDTSSEEGEGNSSLTISQNIEIDTTENCLITICDNSSDISLIDVGADEIRNGTTSNCQFCRSSFESLNELRLHCFIEHNLESSKTTVIHASSSFEGTLKKKEDIHRCKGISKCTKRELEAGKRVNVT